MNDSLLLQATNYRRCKVHHKKIMLNRSGGSAHSSESESESMGVPGEVTPPSVGSKDEKVEIPFDGNGKPPNSISPETVKEQPKPRASVLEYKSVSQMYVRSPNCAPAIRKCMLMIPLAGTKTLMVAKLSTPWRILPRRRTSMKSSSSSSDANMVRLSTVHTPIRC